MSTQQNSKMIVTALTIFFMFSYAKAQEDIKIDFDGRSSMTMNIIEVIKSDINNTIAMEMPALEFEPEILDKTDKKELNKNLDYSIKSALEYCRKNNFSILENNFRNLLQYGTTEEKYAFVYNQEKNYTFPERLIRIALVNKKISQDDFDNLTKIRPQTCVASHTEEVCINRPVCRVVCASAAAGAGSIAGGNVGAAIAIGASGQICRELCEIIPECSQIPVCDEWVDEPLNVGQDANGNWE